MALTPAARRAAAAAGAIGAEHIRGAVEVRLVGPGQNLHARSQRSPQEYYPGPRKAYCVYRIVTVRVFQTILVQHRKLGFVLIDGFAPV